MFDEFAQHPAAFKGICTREKQLKRGKLTPDHWANQNQMCEALFYASRNGKDADAELWQRMVDWAAENVTVPMLKKAEVVPEGEDGFNHNFPRWVVCDRVIAKTEGRVVWDRKMRIVRAADEFNIWREAGDGANVKELIREEIESLVAEHADSDIGKAYKGLQHRRIRIYSEDWAPKTSTTFIKDVDPEELALPDGQFINLRSMALRPIEVADKVTHTTAVAPDFSDGLDLEGWLNRISEGEELNPLERVLRECLCFPNGDPDPSLVHYFMFAVGVSLIGDNYLRLMFLHLGGGKNGKTLLVGLVKYILGDLCGAPSAQHLFGDYADHPAWLLAFHKTRMTLTTEPPDDKESRVQRFKTEILKEVTGSDPITARKMRAEEITFVSGATPHILLNKLPQAPNDQAFLGRCRIIPWNYDATVAGDDVTLFRTLKEPRYAGHFMAHACQAAQLILADRDLGRNPMPYCQQVEDTTRAWCENESGEPVSDLKKTIMCFMNDNCVPDTHGHEYLRDFCERLREYIKANGINYPCGSKMSFNQQVGKIMDGTGFADTKPKRKLRGDKNPLKCVAGFRFKEHENEELL